MVNGTETSSIKGEGNEACLRCQGKVFEAEKMKTKIHVWHKNCFTCSKVCPIVVNFRADLFLVKYFSVVTG